MGSGAGLRGQQGCEGFADAVLDSEQAPMGLKNRIAVTMLASASLTLVFIYSFIRALQAPKRMPLE